MKLYLFNPSLDCGAGIYSLPDQLLQRVMASTERRKT